MTVNKSHTKGGQYSCDEQMAQGITGQILSGSHTLFPQFSHIANMIF